MEKIKLYYVKTLVLYRRIYAFVTATECMCVWNVIDVYGCYYQSRWLQDFKITAIATTATTRENNNIVKYWLFYCCYSKHLFSKKKKKHSIEKLLNNCYSFSIMDNVSWAT